MATRLNNEAKQTLAEYGVSQAAWLRLYPSCDRCGCPDDRCIGYHHDEQMECDLRYWIEDDLRAGRVSAVSTPSKSSSAACR